MFRSIYKYILKYATYSLYKNLQDEVFGKFLNLKYKQIQNIKNGELMSYITKYCRDIRGGIYSIIAFGIRGLLAISISLSLMIDVNWKLSIVVLIPIIINSVIVIIIKEKIKEAEKSAQEQFTKMSEFVQESTDSIRTVKAFNGEEEQIKIFEEKSKNYAKKNILASTYSALLKNSMAICFGICFGISAIYGTNLIVASAITVGEFIAFNTFIKELYYPLKWLPKLITRLERMQVAYKKLEVFNNFERENLDDSKNYISGDIEIKNLDYSFGNNVNVLSNINIKIKKGETLGIIGTIGSGKTTIANLLLRLYDIEDNKIFIDGTDINKIELEVLRNSFCYITQENFLFSTTIKENISLFNNVFSDEKVKKSSDTACLTEDISIMKNGINTIVGEKGITLSGGQKQRVAIARALLYNKNFVILDDTFSALDNKTEKIILQNLRDLLKNKTCIIISNRISDVKHADNIIVLNNGKIVEQGKHNDLLLKNGLYKTFYNEQSSNEFLATEQ